MPLPGLSVKAVTAPYPVSTDAKGWLPDPSMSPPMVGVVTPFTLMAPELEVSMALFFERKVAAQDQRCTGLTRVVPL